MNILVVALRHRPFQKVAFDQPILRILSRRETFLRIEVEQAEHTSGERRYPCVTTGN